SENSLGYRTTNGSTLSLGPLNTGNAFINIELDMTASTYKITSPLGTSSAIAFQNKVSVDCVRLISKNINSNEFSRAGLHHLRIFKGN
ncbi:MAG: hypothetical protein NTX25_20325, partial [Proteobacteria bacterium]|nr:hypothetical protein [Pseudomonadota bacterium]